jgi:hypothetical protein
MDLWVTLPYRVWAAVKSSGSFDSVHNMADHEGAALDWFKACVKDRLGLSDRPRRLMYCSLSKPPVHWCLPPKRVVVRVRVDPSRVLLFDDRMYVEAMNCGLDNYGGKYQRKLEPLGLCAEEAEAGAGAGADDDDAACLASYQRMFDYADPARDRRWYGPVDLRALAVDLTRRDVRRVWVYRNARRLRGKRPRGELKNAKKLSG